MGTYPVSAQIFQYCLKARFWIFLAPMELNMPISIKDKLKV